VIDRQTTRPFGIEAAAREEQLPVDAELIAFVGEHYERLLRLARLVCRDGTEAADAVQVALEQAWRRRSTLRDETRLRPWLDRIVVREAMRARRAQRTWLVRLLGQAPHVGWIEPRDGQAEELPTWLAFRDEFARLSAEQRAVVALHLHLGYSIAETADLVGAPVETVRSRLRLAKDRLRKAFEEAGS
jgi:RNA polymerase sigma-70 factor (ECF subfamily)